MKLYINDNHIVKNRRSIIEILTTYEDTITRVKLQMDGFAYYVIARSSFNTAEWVIGGSGALAKSELAKLADVIRVLQVKG